MNINNSNLKNIIITLILHISLYLNILHISFYDLLLMYWFQTFLIALVWFCLNFPSGINIFFQIQNAPGRGPELPTELGPRA